MNTIYISAIYISPPSTMGGNTKIIIELINSLCDLYNFVIFTTEPETFKKNLKKIKKISLISIPYNFKKFSYANHLKEVDYISDFYEKYFTVNTLFSNDFFYSASDFGPDIISIYRLKKHYKFRWIASLYLFIPNPFENFLKNYKFPFFKYGIYYFYQRFIFKKVLERFDLCLITNDYDKEKFPKNRVDDLLAIYGGVNIEQIEKVSQNLNLEKKYDAVFCSRLHPQKGISQLLDIWKLVVNEKADVLLAIIGNGEEEFEDYLKIKAKKLKIERNIEWLGYVNNEEKYKIYFQSKLFVHPTIYDNNGMVAAEALCSGLPVIMYDLKKLRFYSKGCVKIAINDKMDYAGKILKLLLNVVYYERVRPSTRNILELRTFWNWKNRANIFKNFIEKYEKVVIKKIQLQGK